VTWTHPRRILWPLGAATLIPIAVLGWLGVRILEQDREGDRQRRREALEVAAGRLALDIERVLNDIEAQLDRGEGIRLSPDGPVPSSKAFLLFGPARAGAASDSPPALARARALEHQQRDFTSAAAAYRAVARSSNDNLRASALLGLGGVLRKNGDRSGALRTYEQLEALGAATVAGEPAALVARQARCRMFEEAGDVARLLQEASDLGRVLATGKWPIDRSTFEVYRDLLQRWGASPPDPAAVAHTEAAIQLWQTWRSGALSPRGRKILHGTSGSLLAIWTGGTDRPVAWLSTSDELEAFLKPVWPSHSFTVAAHDPEGRRLFGEDVAGGVTLVPALTRLPFVLSVAFVDGPTDGGRGRRAVLIGGLSLAFVLMIGAAYGLYRATTRELAVARQQRDFVAAVSHEFRTPLTSMRHLTDLLATRGVTSEERRTHYYGLLAHETERLHRMVENLLSFGRIESGRYAWRLEPVEVAGLVHDVVAEFGREPQAPAREILCDIEDDIPEIRADAEALSRALWNLLENAAKYSDPNAPIRVFARHSGTTVHVGVGDRGVGIQPGEEKRIFQTFVRGADATQSSVRGVGIGLALVKRVVEAHGGSVEVDSEPGRGSTFTLVIPCQES
jgi:signal transduction histidine kinase